MEKLNWEYCECGCKCYVADGTDFHIYWDLKDKFTLFEGRFRNNIKEFSSKKEAEDEAQTRHELRKKGYKGPVGYVSLQMTSEINIHLNKMREIAADALSMLDRFSIDCSFLESGPWYTIETMWGLGCTAMLDYASRYRGMGGLDSIYIRVVRNGNVAEASVLHPDPRRFA